MDVISSLPDQILQRILSFLPTFWAIRTSVMSKRWKRVWYGTPSIAISFFRADPASINKILNSFSSSKIKTLDLNLTNAIPPTATQIDSWIEFAMSRNADNFSLMLSESKEGEYTFPDFFFNNASVKQLSLSVKVYGFPFLIPKCSVSWISLKTLSLSSCKLTDDSIANVISGCPTLETLILNHCRGFYYLDLSKSPNLKRLDILGHQGIRGLVAPYIRYFRWTSCNRSCLLVDVSSLTEANINLDCNYTYLNVTLLQHGVLEMLEKLRNIEKLTIGATLLQILSLAKLRSVPFPHLNINALTLETFIVPSVIPGIRELLRNSPELKKITVYTKKFCATIREEELDRYLITQGLNPDTCWSWYFPTDVVVENANSKHVALFVQLVLENVKTLKMMVLRLEGYLNAEEYQKLLPMVQNILESFKILP